MFRARGGASLLTAIQNGAIMKQLPKLALTALTVLTFLLTGVPAAPAAPRDKDQPPRAEQKRPPQGEWKQPPRADKKSDRNNQRPGSNRPEQAQKSQERKGSKPGRYDGNKWDRGGHQGWNGSHQLARPSSPPKSVGIDQSRARKMARDHKLTGYKPLSGKYQRQMVKGRPLPSRIEHRPVPAPMRHRLPVHHGCEWQVVGRDLVLVAVGSLVIYEIFQNVFD